MRKFSKEEKKDIIQYVLKAESIGKSMDIDEFFMLIERRKVKYQENTKLKLNN